MANVAQYRAVLDDMLKQRVQLAARLDETDAAISAMRKMMPDSEASVGQQRPSVPVIGDGKYAGMSVRWGVLNLLAESANTRMTTSDIASALQAGGIVTSGKSFAANVSAVLSDMYRGKQEVVSGDDGWELTEKGRQACAYANASKSRQITMSSPPAHAAISLNPSTFAATEEEQELQPIDG